MPALLLIDNTQIVARADGAQAAQFAGQTVILQGRMKRWSMNIVSASSTRC